MESNTSKECERERTQVMEGIKGEKKQEDRGGRPEKGSLMPIGIGFCMG